MTRLNRVAGWGVTGWSTDFGALADDSGNESPVAEAYGFERILDPGVRYYAPPDVPGVPRWHEKPGAKGRVFQMGWPSAEPPATESILELGAALSSRRRDLAAGDPQLARFDEAIQQLVSVAERLRAARSSIGFLQPDSVRVGTHHDGSTYVLLPDVGFAWDDSGGMGLYEPDWLAKPQAELVFERGARARNTEYLGRLKQPVDERDLRTQAVALAADEAADVKIVARMIAMGMAGGEEVARWCGAAKSLLRLPGKDVAPDTGAPIWDQVIAPALEGQVPTFAELRLRLSSAKPSEHFLYRPPAPPGIWPDILKKGAAVVAAMGVLYGLWLAREWLIPRRQYAPYCRQVPEGDPLHGKLKELEALEAKSQVEEASRPAFRKTLAECRRLHDALKTCGQDCLREPTEVSLEMAVSDGEAVLARLRARPRPVAAEAPEIEAAIGLIDEAANQAKRTIEPTVVKRLKRQLALRGGGLPSRPAERTEP